MLPGWQRWMKLDRRCFDTPDVTRLAAAAILEVQTPQMGGAVSIKPYATACPVTYRLLWHAPKCGPTQGARGCVPPKTTRAGQGLLAYPEGPGTQILRTWVPKAIIDMFFEPSFLNNEVSGASGLVSFWRDSLTEAVFANFQAAGERQIPSRSYAHRGSMEGRSRRTRRT